MSHVYRHWKRIRGNNNEGGCWPSLLGWKWTATRALRQGKGSIGRRGTWGELYPAYQDPLPPQCDAAIRSTRSSTFLETRDTHSATYIKGAGKNNHLLRPGQRGEMYPEATSQAQKT